MDYTDYKRLLETLQILRIEHYVRNYPGGSTICITNSDYGDMVDFRFDENGKYLGAFAP